MAVRMMSGLTARVIQVLVDFLPAELDLIDTEESDGITTPDIDAGNYFEWERKVIPEFPAMTIRTVSSTPIEVRPDSFGQRVDAVHQMDLLFHCTLAQANSDPLELQKLTERYVNGAMRVLTLIKNRLETSADDNPFQGVQLVEWLADATYPPEPEQDDGAIVRTATLPISIRRVEARV